MYRFAKTAVNISGQAMRQVRHGSSVRQDFHSKYGTAILLSGTVFCTGVWIYFATSAGVVWNLSPAGRLTPKEWREE